MVEVRFYPWKIISRKGIVSEMAHRHPITPHQCFIFLDSLQNSSELAKETSGFGAQYTMAGFKCTLWPDRRENIMFNKRRRSLFKKVNKLLIKTNTELYIVMHRGGRYFTYNSTDRQGWPPNEDDMVRSLSLRNASTTNQIPDNKPPTQISKVQRSFGL